MPNKNKSKRPIKRNIRAKKPIKRRHRVDKKRNEKKELLMNENYDKEKLNNISGIKKLLITEPLRKEYEDNVAKYGENAAKVKLINKFTYQDPDLVKETPGLNKPGRAKTGQKKKYTLFNGSKLYYTDLTDLRLKLSLKAGVIKSTDPDRIKRKNMISQLEAEEYLVSNGRYVITEPNGSNTIINVKTDKLFGKEGILAKKFDIRGVTKNSGITKFGLITGEDMKHRNGDKFTKKTFGLRPHEQIIAVTMYIHFSSNNEEVNDGGLGPNTEGVVSPGHFYTYKKGVNLKGMQKIFHKDDWKVRVNLDQIYKSFEPPHSYYTPNHSEQTKANADPTKLYHKDPYIDPDKMNYSSLDVRYKGFTFNSLDVDVPGIISRKVSVYAREFGPFANIIAYHFTKVSKKTAETMQERGVNFGDFNREFKMPEWANIAYQKNSNRKDEENSCIVKLVSKLFPHLYWDIHKLQTDKGIQLDDFLSFCGKHNIKYFLYNSDGILKYSNGKAINPIGVICAMLFCAHILELYGNKPKRIANEKKKETIFINNGNTTFKKFIEDKIKPSKIQINLRKPTKTSNSNNDITFDDFRISTFFIGNQKYVENLEYVECKKFLEKCNML